MWIFATLFAVVMQTGRNVVSRGLASRSDAETATLARFLFGLPVAVIPRNGRLT